MPVHGVEVHVVGDGYMALPFPLAGYMALPFPLVSAMGGVGQAAAEAAVTAMGGVTLAAAVAAMGSDGNEGVYGVAFPPGGVSGIAFPPGVGEG